MLRTSLGLIVLLALQIRPLPPTVPGSSVIQDPTYPPSTGHSEIHGRVVNGRTRQAVAGVRMLAGSEDPSVQAITVTNADGRFAFIGLPAGRYSVLARSTDFRDTRFGETQAPYSGMVVDLRANAKVDNIDISVSPGGEITGTVVDESGTPMGGVYVRPLQRTFTRAVPLLHQFGNTVMTDNRGGFRLSHLPPTEFFVSATAVGRIGYGTTYYPGSLIPARATAVTVTDEKSSTVKLQLIRTSTASVAVTVLGPDRRPMPGGRLLIAPAETNQPFTVPVAIGGDGRLVLRDIPPGTYNLHTADADPRTITASSMGTLVVEEGTSSASVVLTAQKRAVIHGKVVMDAAARRLFHPSAMVIGVSAAGPIQPLPGSQGYPGTIKDDLTFEATSWPGTYTVRLVSQEAGWAIKSVRLNGTDRTENGFDVPSLVDVRGLEVELTNQPPQVTGTVKNLQGSAAGQYVVLLFAQNQDLWKNGTRHVALAPSDQNGRFLTRTLLPGAYLAVALPGVSLFSWTDPAFLEKLRPVATSFSLADGEAKTLALTLKATPAR